MTRPDPMVKATERLARAIEHQNQLTIEMARNGQTVFGQYLSTEGVVTPSEMAETKAPTDEAFVKIPAYLLGPEGEPLPNSDSLPNGYAKITDEGMDIHISRHNYTDTLREVMEMHEPVAVTIGLNYREKD